MKKQAKKEVKAELYFEFTESQGRRLIAAAKKKFPADRFYGDDDLRDAVHEMLYWAMYRHAHLSRACCGQNTSKSKPAPANYELPKMQPRTPRSPKGLIQ